MIHRQQLRSEVEGYGTRTGRHLNVKQGCTGRSGSQRRSDPPPWDDGIYIDLVYIDHRTLLLIAITVRTLAIIARTEGAY